MKAAYFREHGGPEVLEVGELAEPTAGPGEVIVEVHAVGLNHLDLWTRRGIPGLRLEMPHIGGCDVAGVVATVHETVSGWNPGDRVVVNPSLWCGSCEWCARGEHSLCRSFRVLGEHVNGGAAEKIAVPARNLYPLPEGFPFEQAAAVPLVFQTAWRALIGQGRLRPGETVLITGASGGVATAAVQIAKLAGATVLAVTSGSDNVNRLKKLGADTVIDRLETDFSRSVWETTGKLGVDVVLDSVGEAMWDGCLRALAKGGRLITYGATTGHSGPTDLRYVFWRQIAILGTTMAGRGEFETAMRLVFAGQLHPVVEEVLPLDRIREAHERLEAGEVFGKLVLVP